MAERTLISIKEFCACHNVEHSYIIELQNFGLVEIENNEFIPDTSLPKVEKIIRFHREMNINFEGIEVILNLLERVERQNDEVRQLKNRLRIYE